jgi:hypothetical protein
MASQVRPRTVKGISLAIRMDELISVKKAVGVVYCSWRKRETIQVSLSETVDMFGAKSEADSDFIARNDLVASYVIRIMGSIRGRIREGVVVVDNHGQ